MNALSITLATPSLPPSAFVGAATTYYTISLEKRPTTFQEGSSTGGGGGGGGSREFPSPSPPATTPRNAQGGTSAPAGSSRPLSARLGSGQSAVPTSPSPRSPLLAVRPGAPKRPSSGSLPVRVRRVEICTPPPVLACRVVRTPAESRGRNLHRFRSRLIPAVLLMSRHGGKV